MQSSLDTGQGSNAMDIRDKDQFVCWIQRAIGSHEDGSHNDDNYIELYNILLR